jgi:hypothetical protein
MSSITTLDKLTAEKKKKKNHTLTLNLPQEGFPSEMMLNLKASLS